jgi:phosphoenolpyruvate---glycerone phosphotransferase subunit DhaL
MDLEPSILRSMIVRGTERIVAGSHDLCMLDLAIGDGDHGTNMTRGFEAVLAKVEEIVVLPTGEALSTIGRMLVMTVGGASGPLYGSFFLAAGAAIQHGRRLPEDLVDVFAAGVEAVGARGRSTIGEKTMLDVLIPVLHTLRAAQGRHDLAAQVRRTARESTERTAPLLATKGRAAYLGPRSVGHIDPGAKSSCLIVEAVCDTLEERL